MTTNPGTHNMSYSKEYKAFHSMLERCKNPLNAKYKNYGGRGIYVCDEWSKFENFFASMGTAPIGGSLDRIDNNGHYSPDNCRWATALEQSENRRNTVFIEIDGERKTLSAWCRHFNINIATVKHRKRIGLSIEEALKNPIIPRNKKRI